MPTLISPTQDWRAYVIPWDLKPAPPWDVAPGTGAGLPPAGIGPPWPPYSPVTLYTTTYWPNAKVPAGSFDPFKGWTAQMEPPTMRPAVPGLTS